MKVVVAPNAFKGSLTAEEAAHAMAAGVRRAAPGSEVICVPVADGGDGMVPVFARALEGTIRTARVTGPRGKPVQARFCWLAESATAVIEMAEASGLALLAQEERDPTLATTFGTGELMACALALGARELIVGIGGSATCDGGAGALSALGVRFLDGGGAVVDPTGGNLTCIAALDTSGLHPAWKKVAITVVCDVDNPLLGPEGAARIYGPQKGASPEEVEILEEGLHHLAGLVKKVLGKDMTRLRGGGAAGGLGAGFFAFLDARLRPGVEVVLDRVGLDRALESADIVLTGEGRLDSQTFHGKAPAGVAGRAKKKGIPCLFIAGTIEEGLDNLQESGITAAHALCQGAVTEEEAMLHAADQVEEAACEAVRAYRGGSF